MIKTFEQFVSTEYGKPVNEAFQSRKLREIIKQHGKPKHSWENKMLYDLKDNEIIDILDSRDEYWKKYFNGNGNEATFMLELEDGVIVVISNLGILNKYLKDFNKLKDDVFKKRHSERHKGNLGKFGGDDIHKKHIENVNKIENRRFAEKLQPNVSEIVDAIKEILDDIVPSEWDDGEDTNFDSTIELNGEEYTVYMYCSIERSDCVKQYGAEYYDISFTLDSFEIEDEDGHFTSNEDLGITEKTYGDLFKPIVEDDIEGCIYDYYEHYGVNPADFV
jgi:hypothetical protein